MLPLKQRGFTMTWRHAAIALVLVWLYFVIAKGDVRWPGKSYATHQFTDAGVGHKFAELLFSMSMAQDRHLTYCFDEETFLANDRGDDYSFLLPVIYAVVSKCPPRVAPRYVTSGWCICGGNLDEDCFFSSKRYFNEIADFRLDTERGEDSLSIHLRFGDYHSNGDLAFYTNKISHVRGLTDVQDITFCYHSKHEVEEILIKLKETYPDATFVNSATVMETISCLTKGRMMMTSGSGLSFMAAYLCKECTVFFARPKELYPDNSPYKEHVSSKTSIFYVDRFVAIS